MNFPTKAYFAVPGSGEHFNIDVYAPVDHGRGPRPAIVIASGAGGKLLKRAGESVAGSYLASYHDIATHLANDGAWVFVPSRRGDVQWTLEKRLRIADFLRDRLPECLFADCGPNEGAHTHENQFQELRTVLDHLRDYEPMGLDTSRVGIFGKSSGGGIALKLAAQAADRVRSVALWGVSLTTSQWFRGPKAGHYFETILESRDITHDRERFAAELCDAIDHISGVQVPLLLGVAAADSYAPQKIGPDEYTNPEEQLAFLHYAVLSRRARVVAVKGAEHTMWRESAAWPDFASTLSNWFRDTLGA